jgi:hypothetical protein
MKSEFFSQLFHERAWHLLKKLALHGSRNDPDLWSTASSRMRNTTRDPFRLKKSREARHTSEMSDVECSYIISFEHRENSMLGGATRTFVILINVMISQQRRSQTEINLMKPK